MPKRSVFTRFTSVRHLEQVEIVKLRIEIFSHYGFVTDSAMYNFHSEIPPWTQWRICGWVGYEPTP